MSNENNPNLTEMSRNTLLYKICPMHRIYDCCNGTRDYQCYDCAQLMNKWLDEYDKQIRTEAIDDFVKFASDMPTVETEDGTIRPMWLEEIAEKLKAKYNE